MRSAIPAGFGTLRCSALDAVCTLQMHRPESRNGINHLMLAEIGQALDAAESDDALKVVVLKGLPDYFSTGMDFAEAVRDGVPAPDGTGFPERYGALLHRMSLYPKIIVGVAEGLTLAGGVGLLSVCDHVIAHPESRFGLSEMLWGLLPSMVAPYLIRKAGFRAAYAMTLGTQPVDCETARRWMLVDEVAADPAPALARCVRRFARLDPRTIAEMKRFFRDMWILDEAMERRACARTAALMADPRVTANIRNFVEHGKFPWES